MASPTAIQHTVLIVGGNGFLGSAISKQALAKGWKVISISPTGRPYLSPAGHRPAWSSSPNISWHAADALDPTTYKHLAAQCTAAVHTVGILLEADYKPKRDKGFLDILSGALGGVSKGWGYSSGSKNPLDDSAQRAVGAKTRRAGSHLSYETMNRDTAISVAHTFLSTLQERRQKSTLASTSQQPAVESSAPFVYISAEDLFRPVVDARYITTKRQAEKMISRLAEQYGQAANAPPSSHGTHQPREILDADGAGLSLEVEMEEASSRLSSYRASNPDDVQDAIGLLRPVFIRPGLMYHPHTRPFSTLPAAILEASAAFHKSPPLRLPLPTPASLLSSHYAPASLRPLAKLLTTPPLHIDTVARAVCKAIEDHSVRGPVDPLAIRRLAGWREEATGEKQADEQAPVDPANLLHQAHRPEASAPGRAGPSGNPFAASPLQPHHRQLSTLASPSIATRSKALSGSSWVVTRRTLFGLPDLGKLASSTIGAATQSGSADGRSLRDSQGNQVYETDKVLPLPPALLYDVVSDVDAYRHFVPYCQGSTVFGETPSFQAMREAGQAASDGADAAVLAELAVGFGSFQERYTSEVRMKRGQWVTAKATQPNLVFSHLSTTWTFQPLADRPNETRVRFELCYSFRNPVYGAVAGGVFEKMSAQMMDAFETRAREVRDGPGRVG